MAHDAFLAHLPPCAQCNDLLVEPRETPLMLANVLWLKDALAVTRHYDAQRTVAGQDRLAAAAVAVFDRAGRLFAA